MIKLNKFVFIIIIMQCFSSCILTAYSKKERIVDSVLAKTSAQLEKRYNIRTIGTGGSMMNEVKKLSLRFSVYSPFSIDEGRLLIVNSAKQMLEDINTDPNIKPYLYNFPFKENNIDITIFYSGNENIDADVSKLDYVSIHSGSIDYCKLDYQNIGKTIVDRSESFDEAVSILNSQHKINQ